MHQGLQTASYAAIGPLRDRRLLERVISGLPGFRDLPRADIATLVTHSNLVEARRGEVVARRGERIPGVIALASGSAKVTLRRPDGEEKVLRLLGPGDAFGLAATALDRPCPVDVVALARSAIAIVPPVPVQRLLESDGRFAQAATRALAERLLGLVAELEASVQQSGLQRLACYLDSLAEPNGQPGAWIVRLPATKTTIAARLGVKKETLSRMLHDLAVRRLIEVTGLEIAILDRAGISRLAGAPD